MSTPSTRPDTPGTAQANDRELVQVSHRALRDTLRRPRDRERVERAAWRAAKSTAPRGALVFVQFGSTLITFKHDAVRLAAALRLPSLRHVRVNRNHCGSLLEHLQQRGVHVVIVEQT